MESAARALFPGLGPQLKSKQTKNTSAKLLFSQRVCLSLSIRREFCGLPARISSFGGSTRKCSAAATENFTAKPDLQDGFSASTDLTDFVHKPEDRELKMRVDVSGAKTRLIFDDVFSKLVSAAQPIPGFRRVKGGKTPDIPKDILLHILGPSKVKMQAIKRVINTAVAEITEKEGLKVTNNLKIGESYEELEATFEPGKDFSFDAIVELQEPDGNSS